MFKFLFFINISYFFILLMFCSFSYLCLDLMLILMKNKLNGNKNNFEIAV